MNKVENNIPKKIMDYFIKKPEYLLPSNAIIIGENIPNGIIHVILSTNSHEIVTKVFKILSDYTPNIEKEKQEMLANLVSFFKIDLVDISDMLLDCARELKQVDGIYAGLHMGMMQAIENPNGFNYPFFEGFELKFGMAMGDMAKKLEKKIIITEPIYNSCTDNRSLKYLTNVKLKNGSLVKLYDI